MGLWVGSILAGLAGLAGNYLANKTSKKQAESSEEYKNAYNNANKSIGATQDLVDQYTGNAGYQNSLEQAQKGAGLLANQAVGTATSGARSAGMSKAQAAAMGNQMANQNYANAFVGQQSNAMNMGLNNITQQQGITNAYQGQAGLEQSEKQARYNRASDTMGKTSSAVGTIANVAGNLVGGIDGQ